MKDIYLGLIVFVFIVVLMSWGFPWIYKLFDHEQLLKPSYSPDNKYRIEYYAIPFLPLRPHKYIGFGCSDCPGYIRLLDNETNEVLQEEYFEMTQQVSASVKWKEDKAYLKGFTSLDLK